MSSASPSHQRRFKPEPESSWIPDVRGTVEEYPLSVVAAAFAAGLGLGLLTGELFRSAAPMRRESWHDQVLSAVRNAVPESVQRYFS